MKSFFLAGEVFAQLIWVKWLTRQNRAHQYLSKQTTAQYEHLPHAQDTTEDARDIVCWIKRITRILPGHYLCLTQAIAAQAILSRRNISSTLYCGVKAEPDGSIKAHAWLRCQKQMILGKPFDAFQAVGYFTVLRKS